MIYFEKKIQVDYAAMNCNPPKVCPTLTAYILEDKALYASIRQTRPAVIICPGGAYQKISAREGEPIALRYNGAGFHAFVLNYSVAPTGWPAACCELSKAVAYVRSVADIYHIDPNKIIVCGFSAGGHLAASLGVYYQQDIIRQGSCITGEENKPNGLILAYPVITGAPGNTHEVTKSSFVAGQGAETEALFSLEHHVTHHTPKTFMWHTFADKTVPIESSLCFSHALANHNVPFELHIFPEGQHGLSLGQDITAKTPDCVVPAIHPWMDLSIAWINRL